MSTQRGKNVESLRPTALKATNTAREMVTIIKRPNGGGTWSHWRRIPFCAATQVNAIQTTERTPTKTDTHFASDEVAPLRRQAADVPHTSAATSSVGIITKAATAGSK